ncbi:DNA-binding protein RFX6 isoform X2 [Nematostella vectensis]|uniref:DNA-binding protein RFX6 isoform X2 n=1 Tax=Nematostella vectensis TaxID=45351 RepID=UPI0020778A9E|nr:DNA-binding protein RFX6 isoform X2 [Nematostella vectensis]
MEVAKRKETPSHIALEKKQKQMTETLRWLGENYELKEGMCLPRCVMYTHYLDFCKKNKLNPAGPATFGKIIRQKFPKLTTRRLGTRGQSKYHYYGIQVSESSPYFHSGYSKQGLTRFSTMKPKNEGEIATKSKFSLGGSKTRTLLPEFPNAQKLDLPKGVSLQKVETFIMMYRTHCQRILDTVISANFDGVQSFVCHFWQGMPIHMKSVLQCSVLVDVIAICDSILYKVLIDVLIPSSIQDLPDSLREEIREFAVNLLEWLNESLTDVPSTVHAAKVKVARTFGNALTRQVSFVHLAQTARSVLLSYDSVSRMMDDLRKIDWKGIMSQITFITGNMEFPEKIKTYIQEFENLLTKQAPLEAYTEWLDSTVDRCILKPCKENGAKFDEKSAKFLGLWSLFTTKLLEDLTLRSAPSFGVFHLIQTTFQEYVFLIMENQRLIEVDRTLHRSLQVHTKQEFQEENVSEKNCISTMDDAQTPREKKQQQNLYSFQTVPRKGDSNNNKTKGLGGLEDISLLLKTVSPVKQANPTNPASIPRQIPTSFAMQEKGHQRQAYSQHQSPNKYQTREATPQYMFSEETNPITPHPSEMALFHNEFTNAVEKNFQAGNGVVGNPDFMSWMQSEGQSLTVLNTVNYDSMALPGNPILDFHRNGDYGLGYPSDPNGSLHPAERGVEFPFGRKDDYSYSNAYTRYNNFYFDSMRATGQGQELANFASFLQQPAPAIELENMISGQEAQSRLQGVGTV